MARLHRLYHEEDWIKGCGQLPSWQITRGFRILQKFFYSGRGSKIHSCWQPQLRRRQQNCFPIPHEGHFVFITARCWILAQQRLQVHDVPWPVGHQYSLLDNREVHWKLKMEWPVIIQVPNLSYTPPFKKRQCILIGGTSSSFFPQRGKYLFIILLLLIGILLQST